MFGVNSTANSYVLANLRQINSDIATSQERIGTGRKVNSASDNSTAWTLAQGIRSEQKVQDTLTTGIGLAKARADAAVSALDTTQTLLSQIKSLALEVSATNPADLTASNAKLVSLTAQVTATMAGAKFQGENWLTDAVTASVSGYVTIGYVGTTGTQVAAGLVDQDATGTGWKLLSVATSFQSNTGTTTLISFKGADLAAAVDTAATQLTAYQATLSTFSSSLEAQQDFQKALSSIRAKAVSDLVDADLTEESAKVTALQTQQQLAYQALSIGNSSSQNILRLFQ